MPAGSPVSTTWPTSSISDNQEGRRRFSPKVDSVRTTPLMKILRFRVDGREAYGILEGEDLVRELDGPPFGGVRPAAAVHRLAEVELLAPVRPGKIIALGLNYRGHAREMNENIPDEPIIFMKPSTAVIGPGEAIRLPLAAGRVDYEAELALVVGRRARNVDRASALDAVLGVTCFNDVTARDLQRKDGQWTRAKSFDTFAPLGPWIETDGLGDHRTVECLVNGETRQRGSTGDLIFDAAAVVAFVSRIMTLEPGDCIATGTPPGIGPLAAGDRVEVRISGIGSLENPVTADHDAGEGQTGMR